VKQVLLVGSMVVALSNIAVAQGSEVYTRCGSCGSHFDLAADTQLFNYEATISGVTGAYVATLEVYHNGVLKASVPQVVVGSPPIYLFAAPVDMATWGLRAGDQVTFRLRVVRLGGGLLSLHTTIGDVVPAECESANE